jgi:hypothetical protein
MGAECPLPDSELVPQVNESHRLREEFDERIKLLKAECPTNWKAISSGIKTRWVVV